MQSPAWPLLCPVCETGLATTGHALLCPKGHSFDIAGEGYANLLLKNQRADRVIGDAAEMLKARRSFLSQGFFGPLSDALSRHVAQSLGGEPATGGKDRVACIAETGCGEGYYLSQLKGYLDSHCPARRIDYLGLDISKVAVRLAAKRHREIRFVVADVKSKILFASRSIRVLLNIFSPRNVTEFERVLASNGVLFIVIPGPEHLAGLRQKFGLLEIEENKLRKILDGMSGALRMVRQDAVEYDLRLENEALGHLVRMTPNYWHRRDQWEDRLKTTAATQAKASFRILEFRR